MNMIFDTGTGELTIDHSDVHPWGADLRAVLNRHGQVIDLTGVEMRLTITADGAQVFDLHLPPPRRALSPHGSGCASHGASALATGAEHRSQRMVSHAGGA